MKRLYVALCFTFVFSSCIKDDTSQAGGTPLENFNLLWHEVNDNYCYLDYKEVDWNSIGDEYRGKVHDGMSDEALFEVCADMLSELKDGHVNLYSHFNTSRYWDWFLAYPQNFNNTIVERNYLGENYIIANRLSSQNIRGVGYLRCASFMDSFSFSNIDAAVNQLGEIEGLIIDVRDNGGGIVNMAKLLASAFCSAKTHYGYLQYKEGKGDDNYSDYFARYLEPQDKVVFSGKIVVLANRLSYSATNDFVSAMSCLDNVTIIGDKTGGGGGLPFSSELYNGWQVRLSRNPLFNKDKEHIEFGIEPDIYVDMDKDDEYNGIDSIIEYAIKYLGQ
ncbi:MAG: S41 family peptidase [Mangrovibacterium sp.]